MNKLPSLPADSAEMVHPIVDRLTHHGSGGGTSRTPSPSGKVLENPDGYGLTEREKSELPHLDEVVWKGILSPLSHIPEGGWSGQR